MSASATVTTPSRPKVFRPPAPPPQKIATPSGNAKVVWLLCGLVLLALAVASVVVQKRADRPGSATAGKSPPADSDLSPIVSDAAASSENSGKTIVLQGPSGTIIGQLARIPGQTEQITEIKAVSDIDNDAGRELLSIISKY